MVELIIIRYACVCVYVLKVINDERERKKTHATVQNWNVYNGNVEKFAVIT